MYELHIWGPGFGLPSLDPECLAALSYLQYELDPGSWVLIAGNDPSVSSDHVLPALRDNNNTGTCISGFLNIASYLSEQAEGRANDGPPETTTQSLKTEVVTYASYVSVHAAELIAYSLYASTSAWSEVTRPAFSSLLPFPLTWTVPLAIQQAAACRAEHLVAADGSSSDDDSNFLTGSADHRDDTANSTSSTSTSTGFLRLPIRMLPLREAYLPELACCIRVTAQATEFLEVLGELWAKRRDEDGEGTLFLFRGNKPTYCDFLVFAYLRFMLIRTPLPFVERTLNKDDKGLGKFMENMRHQSAITWENQQAFDARPKDYKSSSQMSQQPKEEAFPALPWRDPKPSGFGVAARFASDILENVPGLGEVWRRRRHKGSGVQLDAKEASSAFGRLLLQMPLGLAGSVIAVGVLGVAAAVSRGLSPMGAPVHFFEGPRESYPLFGGIGTMLDDIARVSAAPRPGWGASSLDDVD